jgi:two-component system OmpR family response regulator
MEIKKVLLVDDDSRIRRIVELSLSKIAKWEVLLADCGLKGFALAVEHVPDVIVLDMMMPDIDGITTMRMINQHFGDGRIPIVFLTAKVQRQEMAAYDKMEAAGVISKPFDPMTLSNQIFDLVQAFALNHSSIGLMQETALPIGSNPQAA